MAAPDVDAEFAGEHRQLVDQRDVDVAERVLEQLDQLGLGRRTDRHRLVDQRSEEPVDRGERGLVDAARHLRRVDERVRDVARVDPLGGVAEPVLAGPEARRLLEDRAQQFGGRAGVGRALEDHARPGPQMAPDVRRPPAR